jgi:hypothetical protein
MADRFEAGIVSGVVADAGSRSGMVVSCPFAYKGNSLQCSKFLVEPERGSGTALVLLYASILFITRRFLRV